jgi:S-adenosylmethionine synthetase
VEYRDRRPYRIHSITVIASQSRPPAAGGPDFKQLRDDLQEAVLDFVFQEEEIKPPRDTHVLINPDGPFIGGGPAAHAGLTGRKTAIDTYGEYDRHSGSALSGKDPLRIDRVGAYAARYAAKNVVAADLADECEVQLCYSIGLSRPVSLQVETFGTGKIADDAIATLLKKHFDFRLAGIIRQFNLRYLPSLVKGGFYRKLTVYGYVVRTDIGLSWFEAHTPADTLRREAGDYWGVFPGKTQRPPLWQDDRSREAIDDKPCRFNEAHLSAGPRPARHGLHGALGGRRTAGDRDISHSDAYRRGCATV